jgi:hypothetical protein
MFNPKLPIIIQIYRIISIKNTGSLRKEYSCTYDLAGEALPKNMRKEVTVEYLPFLAKTINVLNNYRETEKKLGKINILRSYFILEESKIANHLASQNCYRYTFILSDVGKQHQYNISARRSACKNDVRTKGTWLNKNFASYLKNAISEQN